MGKAQKVLLVLFLSAVIAVIVLTWGSIASAVLTLALIIAIGALLLRWFVDTHDPSDLQMDD